MKHSKKILKSITTGVLSGCTGLGLMTLVGCSTVNKQSNVITFDDNNGIEYCYVNFVNVEGVTYVGQTKVQVEKGSYFADVVTPLASKGQLKFSHWSDKAGGDEIPASTIIGENFDVYPVFEKEIELSNCVRMQAIDDSTITVCHPNLEADPKIEQDLWYSTNYGEDWTEINEVCSIELDPGDSVYFKGNNPNGLNQVLNANTYNVNFQMSENSAINMTGNIMGLLDNGLGTIKDIPQDSNGCFRDLFAVIATDPPFDKNSGLRYVSNNFLPATNLAESCYSKLFMNQKHLLTAPWLPATELKDLCYYFTFAACSSLNFLKVGYTGNFNETYMPRWVEGINASGTFIYNGADTTRGGSAIPTNWNVYKAPDPVVPTPEPQYPIVITCEDKQITDDYFVDNHPYKLKAVVPGDGDVYQDVTWVSGDTSTATVNPATGVVTPVKPGTCTIYAYSKVEQTVAGKYDINIREVKETDCTTFTSTYDTTVSWDYGGGGKLPTFKYSWDHENWFQLIPSNVITLPQGKVMYVKGDNPTGLNDATSNSHARFIFNDTFEDGHDAKVSIGGKINSLIDDARGWAKAIPCNFCFNTLFANNESIESVDPYFLSYFPGDEEEARPGLTVGCYKSMFEYCIGLKNAPELPNMTVKDQCYLYMFRGCIELTETPALPATTLDRHCYKGMFYGCVSLTKSPALPAEHAVYQCYHSMFTLCTGLKEIGNINIKDFVQGDAGIGSCQEMFWGVGDNAFFINEEKSGATKFFTCPDLTDCKSVVLAMFQFNESDKKPDPVSGESWYYVAR